MNTLAGSARPTRIRSLGRGTQYSGICIMGFSIIHKKGQFEGGLGPVQLRRVPNLPGSYAVIMYIDRSLSLCVGALGRSDLKVGYYCYVGSAFGPGGLRGRLGHHVRGGDRFHWHVDYLRSVAEIVEIWWTMDSCKREHDWARVLGGELRLVIPIRGFGSSDCSCRAHLFYAKSKPSVRSFSRRLHLRYPNHGCIHSMS